MLAPFLWFVAVLTVLQLSLLVPWEPLRRVAGIVAGAPAKEKAARTAALVFMGVEGVFGIAALRSAAQLGRLERRSQMDDVNYYSNLITALCCLGTIVLAFTLDATRQLQETQKRQERSISALKRQAENLSKEYDRVTTKADSEPGSEKNKDPAELERRLKELEEERDSLIRSREEAKASLEAIQSQAEGLSSEYERLHEVNESLRSQLKQLDRSSAGQRKKAS